MDIAVSYSLYILLGIMAGLLSGLLGVGGGVVVVPGLIWIFKEQGLFAHLIMHVAIGTSLAAMVVTSSFSLYAHYRQGAKFGTILYFMIPGLIMGTAVGAIIAHYTHSHVLKLLFGLLMIAISLKDIFGKSTTSSGQAVEPPMIKISLGSLVVGVFSGLLGVGGGTMLVPYLRYYGIEIKHAISLSIVCGLAVSITGAISDMLTGATLLNLPTGAIGYVYLPAAMGIAIGSPVFAYLGTRLNRRLPVGVIRKIFNVFLLIVGVQLIY